MFENNVITKNEFRTSLRTLQGRETDDAVEKILDKEEEEERMSEKRPEPPKKKSSSLGGPAPKKKQRSSTMSSSNMLRSMSAHKKQAANAKTGRKHGGV